MKKFLFIWIIVFCFWCVPAHAISLIRDTEIEDALMTWVRAIFKAADLEPESARVALVNDPSINAFVAGGQTIFIHTGLITQATTLDDLMFVLSHETGHIVGGHVTRGMIAYKNAQTASLISTILGGVIAEAAGRPDAGIAVMVGSQSSALGSFLSYRQTEESSADRTAVDIMNKLGYSMQGFTNTMHAIQHLERINMAEDGGYLRTHPLSQTRIQDVARFTKNAPTPKPNKTFDRIRAKLIGFMNDPKANLQQYTDDSMASMYIRTVSLYRLNKRTQAVALLDKMIQKEPQNPYLYELKGQFYFETGDMKNAITNYEKADKLKPYAPLIETALAQSYLETKTTANTQKALRLLQHVVLVDEDATLAWRLMASAYDAVKQPLNAEYAMVEYNLALDKKKQAFTAAEKLAKKMPTNDPHYQRLQDIIELSKKED